MSCGLSRLDGAYVLGALSAEDRRLFEDHLPDCPECTRAVAELSGLPRLLAQLDAAEFEDLSSAARGPTRVPAPVPATLLPALVGEVRRVQRRRMLVTAGSVAAAVIALGALAISQTIDRTAAVAVGPSTVASSTVASATTGASNPTPGAAVRALEPIDGQVVPAGMSAGIAMTSVAWGTRLDLTCSYGNRPSPTAGWTPDPEYPDGGADYALVVHTREGAVQQVATWHSLPGRTMRLVGATAARVDDIVAIEVRSEHGDPLLRTSG